MPLIFADNFLAGSLLSLLLPTLLLIAIVIWYLLAVRRVPTGNKERPETTPHAAESPTGTPESTGTNP